MTTTPETNEATGPDGRGTPEAMQAAAVVEHRLERALKRAHDAILWERVWPAVVAVLLAIGLFLIASWAGLWLVLPPLARIAGVVLAFVLLAVALIPAMRVRPPDRSEALGRLDRESRLPHRPATALADQLASRPDDPVAVALWRAHITRMSDQISRLRAGLPSPGLAAVDPRAFRALVALGVVATFFMASGDHARRILAAFDWSQAVPPTPYRIDAWVTPPAYTGRPPVVLPGLRSAEGPDSGSAAAPGGVNAAALTVPAGSVLVVRVTGLDATPVATDGGVAPQEAEAKTAEAAAAPAAPAPSREAARKAGQEQRFVIAGDGGASLSGPDGGHVSWRFSTVADRAPTISFAKEPQAQGRTGIALSYRVEDDYGVASAEAKFALAPPPRPLYALKNAPAPKPPRALVAAPDFPLPLPGSRARSGVGQTSRDFTENPWAGARVTLTLTARDEAGNVGSSEPRSFVLPARSFSNPLARALIEQRRTLALDIDSRPRVERALAALAIEPDKFTPDFSHYMGLTTAHTRLRNARSDDDLRGVVDYLWDIAVHIEDGDLSDVEKQLRAAQEALQQALENGASDEEIQRLTQDLRAAMDKFMQALAEQAQRNPEQATGPMDPNTRLVRPEDLSRMLDRIEQMARNGARDAARQMLSELQNMLNGLQNARPQQRRGGQNEMSDALDQLGNMIQQQQRLRDRTYREQQGNQPGQRGQQGQRGQRQQPGQQQPGEGDQQAFGDLQKNQEQLRQQLRQLLDKMQQAMRQQGQQGQGEQGQQGQPGQQPGEGQGQGQGPGGQQLGDAEQAMRDAEGALGEGDGQGAVDAQGRALQALRKGAQSMQQAMQPGEGNEPGSGPSGETAERNDPMGRPMRSRDYGDDVTVKVPDDIEMQRARRVLEELRRRIGEPERPRLELDYLERLLRDF
ncbi:TIGR02302 family protein [Ancylobacter terrae]|uniref:TIGR02302 family protein n=1 Tax=Ancylobacter sp. sgz301288 TaxID=3342077 RepID=UPI00385800A4